MSVDQGIKTEKYLQARLRKQNDNMRQETKELNNGHLLPVNKEIRSGERGKMVRII